MTAPILRTSERSTWERCPRKWWWAYREGLVPIGAESTPFWFGTITHAALAAWYIPGVKRGIHPAQTFTELAGEAMRTVKVVTETDEATVAQWEDAATLGVTLLEEYVKHWGLDPAWDFIQAEQQFSLDIPWPKPEDNRQGIYEVDSDSGPIVVYKGTYDGVYRDLRTGRIELLETKTAKSIQTGHLTLDNQAGSYWAVATATLRKQGLIGLKENISGINYNFLRKGLPDTRPLDPDGYATNKPVKADYARALGLSPLEASTAKLPTIAKLEELAASRGITVLGERSKVQPAPLFQRELVHRTSTERTIQLRRIQDEAVHMQAVRDGLLPLIKSPNYACHRECQFFAMCELEDRGGTWQELRRIAFRQRDPYADHRKSTDE